MASLGVALRIVGKPMSQGPRDPRSQPREPSLENLRRAVPDRTIAALLQASAQLGARGIRHGVIGALAIGVYGWPRATRDIDLLVGPEAWRRMASGGLEALIDFPEEVGGVHVDYLHIDVAGDFLIESLDRPWITGGVPVAPIEVVVCTKLLRMHLRDEADVVEVLKAGLVEAGPIAAYLDRHAPMLTPRFDRLVARAIAEASDDRKLPSLRALPFVERSDYRQTPAPGR